MKLLTSAFFTLLLIGFAGGSYGKDFDETKLLAEQGYMFAQFSLGNMYANGRGVPENGVVAYVWFSVAVAQGDENAQFYRDILSKRLTSDQLAQAQQIAALSTGRETIAGAMPMPESMLSIARGCANWGNKDDSCSYRKK
jgi:TPR repeat protein